MRGFLRRECRSFISGISLLLFSQMAMAASNTLTAVQVHPLPAGAVDFQFQFKQPLTATPPHFLTEKPARMVLDFSKVASSLKQHQWSVEHGAVKSLIVAGDDQRLRAVIGLQHAMKYALQSQGTALNVHLSEKKAAKKVVKKTQPKKQAPATTSTEQKYQGEKISLNFQSIKVRSVLQLLAEFTGLNIVVSDSVRGDITLHLNNVPWDQALSIILKTKGLDKRRMGNVLLVAPTLELSKQEQDALKAKVQKQALTPLHAELLQVNYAKATDLQKLLTSLGTALLSKRGRISVDTRTNMLWVQDTSDRLPEIRRLVKKLDIPVRQVLIEARVVTVTKDFERNLGIRFGMTKANPTNISGNFTAANELAQGTAPASIATATNRLNLNLPAGNSTVGSSPAAATFGVALARLGKGILLDLELSAIEATGQGKTLSTPRVITSNQHSALIESGEEIPYEQTTSSGATAIAFKKALLSLDVTPQITPDNKIILALKVHQDSRSSVEIKGVPAINTESIETQVLINNGGTIVLGGVYKKTQTNNVSRVPFFSDIPIIGNLFKNKAKLNKESELLVFITPRILKNGKLEHGMEALM